MFELRSYRSGDGGAVWRIHDAALEGTGVHGGSGPWEDDLRDIDATYIESGGDFLVGCVDGRVVGIGGLLLRPPRECEIKRMRVDPEFQRRGLGRLILRELEGRARARGCELVRLDTTEEQREARQLYESEGYRETGRRETERFVFIDMVKELRAAHELP